MRTLLVVEDDGGLSASLARGLPSRVRELRVLLAEDGAMALEVLAAQPVDLVLTDLNMPGMDGFELIARLSDSRPTLPVLVMTAMPIAEANDRLRQLQGVEVLSKPVDLAAMAAAIEALLSRAQQGFIQGVSLMGFLQLLAMEHRTCTLRVSSRARRAAFFLVGGEALALEVDGVPGGDAEAHEVLVWEDVRLGVDPGPHGRTPTLQAPIRELLLDASRLQDERRRAKDQVDGTFLSPPGRSVVPVPRPPRKPR
jgi:DNA-binding response OmpR family regulator